MTTTDKIKALPDGGWLYTENETSMMSMDRVMPIRDLKSLVSELDTKTRALDRFAEQDCCRDDYPQQYADGNCQHCIAQAALKGENVE